MLFSPCWKLRVQRRRHRSWGVHRITLIKLKLMPSPARVHSKNTFQIAAVNNSIRTDLACNYANY